MTLLAGRAVQAQRVDLRHRAEDGAVTGSVVARQPRPVATHLLLNAGSHLSPTLGVAGGCSLNQPVGTTTLSLGADRSIDVRTTAVDGFGRLHCQLDIAGGR
jgi:hypothetical protein